MSMLPLPFPPHDEAPGHATAAPATAAPSGRAATTSTLDAHDGRRPARTPDGLAPFVAADVLQAAEVHVAEALCRIRGETDPVVLLAAALAVRAPRLQHVCVDLATVRETVVAAVDDDAPDDPDALPWPDIDAWRERVASSSLVARRDPADRVVVDDRGRDVPPLVLAGTRLYLDRYWRYERRVAGHLHDRAARPVAGIDVPTLRAGLDRRFRDTPPDRQRVAAATAVLRHLAIIAGGPGTGKTTTVAAVLQLLDEQAGATGRRMPRVALAAPTGKAAQRLTESLHEAAGRLDDGAQADRLAQASATTLHRLLGSFGTSRFRHHANDPLPHDVVVVDETSMVDLALLAKLLDAVRPDARVILLGDQHQLASVEAGSVLGDVIGDPDLPPERSSAAGEMLADAVGAQHLPDLRDHADAGVHDGLVVLNRVHRFRAGSGLDRFAAAVRAGDADGALEHLSGADDLTWIAPGPDVANITEDALEPVRGRVLRTAEPLHAAAATGDARGALRHLDDLRVLCAHRRGSHGVDGWVTRVEGWLLEAGLLDPTRPWYVGRPVLVTANDRRLGLWNGDIGIVVAGPDERPTVAFATGPDEVRTFAPSRLAEVQTVHAMTVHKSQGSQVRDAVVVLPAASSRICTRELLYTAVTRARDTVTVIASEAVLRDTIAARTRRPSGLGEALGRTT
ncbi:MAG TPA: exodeoxyribonuclease V subunit alpha [Egicoccus sp.]|nr:exodeoxyribonuclease V subunit alpha [Egicoccus sp.]HSK23757.1 exodeoxyribonuclease V subunit alpha [Egicoccus sp.]